MKMGLKKYVGAGLLGLASLVYNPESVRPQEIFAQPTSAVYRSQDQKISVPSTSEQREAENTIRTRLPGIYDARTPEQLQIVAAKFLKLGIETNDNDTVKYVFLRDAKTFAEKAGNPTIAFAAIESIDEKFDYDAKKERADALRTLYTARDPAAQKSLAEHCLQYAEIYLKKDDFTEAAKYAGQAYSSARKAKDLGIANRATLYKSEISATKSEHGRLKSALEKLEKDPSDKKARADVGVYRCFYKGEWDTALDFLLDSSDKDLATLAQKDLEGGQNGEGMKQIGDAWMKYASKNRKLQKRAEERALTWYKKAWPELSGFTKETLRTTFKQKNTIAGGKNVNGKPESWDWGQGYAIDTSRVHDGSQAVQVKGADGNGSAWSAKFKIVPDKKLKFSAWVLTDGNDGAPFFEVRFSQTPDGQKFVAEPVNIPSDKPWWQKIEREIQVPIDAIDASVLFWPSPNFKSGDVWLDNVSLIDTETGIDLIENGGFEKKR